jgi:hypothetical protein
MPLVEPPSPSHRVHFETTCVVIPEVEESSGIHLLKRSYALPSWRRQRSDESKADTPPAAVITVKVPRSVSTVVISSFISSNQVVPSSLSRKHRHMHSSERVPPLQPCLRHSHSVSCSNGGSKTSSEASHNSGTATLPSPTAFDHSHRIQATSRRSMPATTASADRVPLRECCTACLDSVDQGLKIDYHEHWTKGAQRRRRMSESEADKLPAGCGSAFLRKPVRVDEVDGRKCRRRLNAPVALPPALLEHLCHDDDDESLLFPLPSPRRTPVSGTPLLGTPSSTPPKLSTSRTPSPRSIGRALAKTQHDQGTAHKPLPQLPTGKVLLAQFPDVDTLPSRRAASDSAANTSPPRRPMHSLLRSISPPSFGAL